MKFIAYIVRPDPVLGERHEIVNMMGRVLTGPADVRTWLTKEVPKRADLRGLRIDVVDLDEPLDRPRPRMF